MAQPSVLIVENGTGEVFIVEEDADESQVDRILREARKSSRTTRSKKIKTEIKEEPVEEEPAVKSETDEEEEGDEVEELLEEMLSDNENMEETPPVQLEISFVDPEHPSLNTQITPKKEPPEEIETETKESKSKTFDGRWSSDEEEEEEEPPEVDEYEDISDLELRQAVKDIKPKKSLSRSGWGKHKKNNLKGKPICKYCELEFWTFRAKVEHMEVCEFLQCNPKNYICRICFKELSKKTFSNHLHETLDCLVCGKQGFVNPRVLKNHIEKRHGGEAAKRAKQEIEEEDPEIEEETQSAENPEDLQETFVEEVNSEIEGEAPKPKKPEPVKKLKCRFECDRCGKYLVSHNALMNHSRLHMRKHTFICENCGSDFYTKNGLTKHNCKGKRKRPEVDYRVKDMRYCRFCDTRFNDLDERSKHDCKYADPNNKKMVFCRVCNKHLNRDVFNRHWERHAEGDWHCTICNREMATERGLKLHMTLHTGNKPYPCEQCSESFINTNALKRHMRYHGAPNETFTCEHCCKQLSSKKALDGHIIRVHELKIMCEICKAELPTKADLKLHYANDHEPSVCDVCGKGFRLPRYLKMHEKHHYEDTVEKIQCTICFKLLSLKKIKPHVYRNHFDQFETWKEAHPTY